MDAMLIRIAISTVLLLTGLSVSRADCQTSMDPLRQCLTAISLTDDATKERTACRNAVNEKINDCSTRYVACDTKDISFSEELANNTRHSFYAQCPVSGCRSSDVDPIFADIDRVYIQPTRVWTSTDCKNALKKLKQADDAIQDYVTLCVQATQIAFSAKLQTFETKINQQCENAIKCKGVGTRLLDFHKCTRDHDLTAVISRILMQFNQPTHNDVTACDDLRTLRNCWKSQTHHWNSQTDKCDLILEQKFDIYRNNNQYKMVEDICGVDHVDFPREIPCISSFADSNRDYIKQQCKLSGSFTDSQATLVRLCRTMQDQIDCIMTHSGNCKEIEEEFLQPKLHSYAFVNQIFGCNVSINGVWVKDTNKVCKEYEYLELYECFARNGLKTILETQASSFQQYWRFFTLNTYNAKEYCVNLRQISYSALSTCLKDGLKCTYPFPTFGSWDAKKMTVVDLYRLLKMGPFPANQYGKEYIQDETAILCSECTDAYLASYPKELDACLSQLERHLELWRTDKAAGCRDLESAVQCVRNRTQKCPIFGPEMNERLTADESIRAAVKDCDIELKLVPASLTTSTNVPIPGGTTLSGVGSTITHKFDRTTWFSQTSKKVVKTTPWQTAASTKVSASPTKKVTTQGPNQTKNPGPTKPTSTAGYHVQSSALLLMLSLSCYAALLR